MIASYRCDTSETADRYASLHGTERQHSCVGLYDKNYSDVMKSKSPSRVVTKAITTQRKVKKRKKKLGTWLAEPAAQDCGR